MSHDGTSPDTPARTAGKPERDASWLNITTFLLAIAFLIVVVRINGAMVGLVAQLLQLAAAVGFALVAAIVVGAAFVVLILHG